MGGCQPYPISHSTHVVYSSPSCTLPWSVHSLTTIFGLLAPHAQVLGRFWVSRRFSSSPHELLSTHELQNRVFPVVCASTGKNGAVFLHAGPPLSVIFLAGSDCLPTRRYSSVWGAHSELRAVILHPRLTVKGHSRFWLSHRLVGSFFPVVVCLLLCFWGCAIRFPCFKL